MPPGRPPLDLHADVTLADGSRYRWDSGGKACDRPQGISFRTKKGDGFADAGLTLSRRIDRDYVDLNLLDDFALVGYDGSVAYEGRVGANPRSLGESSHQMSVQLQGWMSHAKDRKFREIYVDRDLSSWQPPSRAHRAALLTATYNLQDFNISPDQSSGLPSLNTVLQGPWNTGVKQVVWALYDAGPEVKVASFYYDFVGFNAIGDTDFNWRTSISASDDRTATNTYTSGDQQAASGSGTFTGTTAERYGFLQFEHVASVGGGTSGINYEVHWRNLAVYGSHGLTGRGSNPNGFYASDVITNIVQRFCPKLNTAGVQPTTYVIPHLAYKDPIFPFDAFLDVNKYHLWSLGVWENKTLTYEPYDLSDYDWEIRLSDPGVTVDLQGDSVEQLANGICVNFTDVATGVPARITPLTDTTLADTSVNNPANSHGLTLWTEITLSSPTTAVAAAQIGRAALAEFNQPKGPGTIRVTGYIRDRGGHWQPGWKVRADQRIAITDHPNDRPRLIVETDWNHDSKQLTIGVDSTLQRVDAVLDRISTALQAANLT